MEASDSCTSEAAWCHAGRARSRSSSRKAREPQSPDPVQQAAGKEASLAAAKVTEEAAEPAAVLEGRVPLLYKGLTQQQYAALQQQKATKGPRKALAFQYPSGRSHKKACSGRTMHLKSGLLDCVFQLSSSTKLRHQLVPSLQQVWRAWFASVCALLSTISVLFSRILCCALLSSLALTQRAVCHAQHSRKSDTICRLP